MIEPVKGQVHRRLLSTFDIPILRIATVVTISIAGTVSPQERPEAQQNEGGAFFYAISDLPYNPEPELQVIKGRIGDPQDWPASFYSLADGGRCTSSLVGSRVLLTAAHCVGNGKDVRISKAGRTYRGTCTHAAEYATNRTADWALCELDLPVPGVPYETLNSEASRLVEGGEVLLTGFGCTRPGGTGGNDGIYRIGESNIRRLPRGGDYDIITKGGAALCFGDSGGPAFVFLGGAKSQRVLIAVNSRGNILDTSYLSSLTTEAARRFLSTWSQEHEVRICGLYEDAYGCRN
jgi:Trypsin